MNENLQLQVNACEQIIRNQAAMIRDDMRAWVELLLEHRIPFTEIDACGQPEMRKRIGVILATIRRVDGYLKSGDYDVAAAAVERVLKAQE